MSFNANYAFIWGTYTYIENVKCMQLVDEVFYTAMFPNPKLLAILPKNEAETERLICFASFVFISVLSVALVFGRFGITTFN